MRIFREEIFGPVLSVTPFSDEAEAVALANATDYGLSAAVWTANLGRALRVARQLQSGQVIVNGGRPETYHRYCRVSCHGKPQGCTAWSPGGC